RPPAFILAPLLLSLPLPFSVPPASQQAPSSNFAADSVSWTGATKSLAGGEPGKPAFYSGFPAGPIERVRKEMVFPRRLPNILSRLKSIEDQLSAE
ncbi:MAG: hypothetical protein MK172_14530, partial [Verrucomicrobiales bacterium]|nr:hypothetical protein [Verrucomicrobiales bacterium]